MQENLEKLTRYDTLAQMLTLGNIRAGNEMIVMEACSGLVLGAMMDLMGGFGSITQLYPGDGPVWAATACFGFPKSFLSGLHEFPLNKVNSLLNGTFSAEMLASEPKDSTPVGESNSELEEKEIAEQVDEDNIADAPEGNAEQRPMEIVPGDPENKEPKEKRSKRLYSGKTKETRRAEEKAYGGCCPAGRKKCRWFDVASPFPPHCPAAVFASLVAKVICGLLSV